MRRYAERTSVPASQTRNEVEQLLARHGATGFMFGSVNGKALVVFEMPAIVETPDHTKAGGPAASRSFKTRRLRFLVPMPDLNKTRSNQREVDAEIRRRWRALLLVLKAKLEAVASEIVTFDEEFLAHIMIDGKTTIGDHMIPQMHNALAGGKMPNLLTPGDA